MTRPAHCIWCVSACMGNPISNSRFHWVELHRVPGALARLKKTSIAFLLILQPGGKKSLSESAWASLNSCRMQESNQTIYYSLKFPPRPVLQVLFLKLQALRLTDIPSSILTQTDTTSALSVDQSQVSPYLEITKLFDVFYFPPQL